jgi:hypothetical protein
MNTIFVTAEKGIFNVTVDTVDFVDFQLLQQFDDLTSIVGKLAFGWKHCQDIGNKGRQCWFTFNITAFAALNMLCFGTSFTQSSTVALFHFFCQQCMVVVATFTHQMVCCAPRNCRNSWHFITFGASEIFLEIIHEFFFEAKNLVFALCIWVGVGHFLLIFRFC